jgi:hypothetical protein
MVVVMAQQENTGKTINNNETNATMTAIKHFIQWQRAGSAICIGRDLQQGQFWLGSYSFCMLYLWHLIGVTVR